MNRKQIGTMLMIGDVILYLSTIVTGVKKRPIFPLLAAVSVVSLAMDVYSVLTRRRRSKW